MRPGPAALCEGSVVHRRAETEAHQFTYPVSQVWLDPDRPGELCDLHWAWSARRPAPVRFRRSDYGGGADTSLANEARTDLSAALDQPVTGPVRMLTQLRRWGWLFNPITVFFCWDAPDESPVGAVLEVTNTPWKERRRYPIPLAAVGTDLVARFDKALHVSPFLGMDYEYRFRAADRDDRLAIDIDVIDASGEIAVHTALRTKREPATPALLARSVRTQGVPTHRVSAGIHAQAARLWRKGVPFVPHPDKRPNPASP